MPVCPRCGLSNPDGSRFCNACAEPLTAEVVASGEAMQAALRQDRAEETAPSPYEPREDPGRDAVYVRWDSWPWSPLRTTEQTFDQFVITSLVAFFAIAIVFLVFVNSGQVLVGGIFAVICVVVWLVRWMVGRS